MAKLVFGMNQSLDGYVDHDKMSTGPVLFRHWTDHVRNLAGSVYGRGMYEIMRYWDDDQDGWDESERAFAEAWRRHSKWVVSRTLDAVGPNASLLKGDLDTAVRALKAQQDGEIQVGGPELAAGLSALGLIDEYRIYLHPVVTGGGVPFFGTSRPRLRFAGSESVGDGVVRLRYLPA